jgi:hypothetical protein
MEQLCELFQSARNTYSDKKQAIFMLFIDNVLETVDPFKIHNMHDKLTSPSGDVTNPDHIKSVFGHLTNNTLLWIFKKWMIDYTCLSPLRHYMWLVLKVVPIEKHHFEDVLKKASIDMYRDYIKLKNIVEKYPDFISNSYFDQQFYKLFHSYDAQTIAKWVDGYFPFDPNQQAQLNEEYLFEFL